jgi:hypothetical protein
MDTLLKCLFIASNCFMHVFDCSVLLFCDFSYGTGVFINHLEENFRFKIIHEISKSAHAVERLNQISTNHGFLKEIWTTATHFNKIDKSTAQHISGKYFETIIFSSM